MTSPTLSPLLGMANTSADDAVDVDAEAAASHQPAAPAEQPAAQAVEEPLAAAGQQAMEEPAPAVGEPESAYGCVDWFLYPVPAQGESAS